MYKRSRTDNFWGDYCNLSYCFTAVVLEVNSVWSCERRVHAGIHASSVRYLLVNHVNHECIKGRALSFSQPNSLTPSKFNTYFTTNHVPSIWEVFSEYLFHRGPRNKGLSDFIYIQSMKNLNGKQNHRPEKETCSYLVKFYRLIDTVYAEYTGLFRVGRLCSWVSSAATL